MKLIKHLITITKHKILVGRLCFRLGLYKQGLLHDLSKYSWTELRAGARYYNGHRSPNSIERERYGYSASWLHHKGRNKHHWEYWVDFTRDGLKPAQMPMNYVLEMFCDRVAASMVYQGKDYHDGYPLIYYEGGQHSYIMHPQTKALLHHLLSYLANHGLDRTIDYIKHVIKKQGYR